MARLHRADLLLGSCGEPPQDEEESPRRGRPLLLVLAGSWGRAQTFIVQSTKELER